MANINEVAKLAGVSSATVSKYINGVKVKPNNAQAIDRAIDELGYRPNDFARGLRTNRSMTIGVLLPELDNLFFTSIISSVDSVLENFGYITVVCICRSDIEREHKKLDFLLCKKIDGLIAVPSSAASDFVRMVDGLPVVLIDRMAGISECACVLSDNFSASYNAAEELISNGHRHIGVLLGQDSNYTPIERRAGFIAACVSHSITVSADYIKNGNYSVRSGYEMTRQLLALPEPPTAIFATNNELTTGAVTALNEAGIIPGIDISFIGFDNLTLAMSAHPRLTVMLQQVDEIGKTAANTLLDIINGKENTPSGIIRLPTKLCRYDSVINITK